MADPKNKLPPYVDVGYRIKFGRSKSNGTSIHVRSELYVQN